VYISESSGSKLLQKSKDQPPLQAADVFIFSIWSYFIHIWTYQSVEDRTFTNFYEH